MPRVASRFLVVAMATLLATGWLSATPKPTQAVSPNVVISQVYGAGGNTGAVLTNDYVELFNRGTVSQSLAGWSIQYASATGTGNFGSTTTQISELPAVSLAPGQYYLVQEAGGANGSPPPTADLIDATPIAMAAAAGKVALVDQATTLGCNGGSTLCSAAQLAHIVDLVGYGTANFFEGTAAPGLSPTTAAIRAATGCTDTDANSTDFAAATPAPQNTATAFNVCPTGINLTIDDVTAAEGDAGTTSFDFTVSLSAPALAGGVTFDIATQDNSATDTDNDYEPVSLTGQSIPQGSSTYTFSVLVNGDVTTEPAETFFANVSNATGAAVSDGQGVGTIADDDACNDPFTPIYDIQGSGLSTPIPGTVTTEGVVVGDFEGTAAASGFYMQDPSGDADAVTSDGIFVFTGSTNLVSVGQSVRVTAFARERFNQTTLNGSNSNSAAVLAANIVVCGSGSVTATDVTLPFASATFAEQYEGMSVRFPQTLVIAEYFNYDRFGEVVLALPLAGETRPFTGTSVDEPGAAAIARNLANTLSRITLDDAQSTQNPAVLRHPDGTAFSLANLFRGGDEVANAVGVLGFDFSLYRIFPTGPADYDATNDRPATPEDVGGNLTVAAMNTLNYFVTADYPSGPLDNKCGAVNTLECRGWDSDQPTELTRQRDKLLQALVGLDADVLGLNELENSLGVDALGDPTNGIVAGLNDILGAGTYDWIDTGVIGTDAIRVGLIYKPGAVTPVGDFKILDSTVDPRFIDTRSRPALAQTFQENATGERFTVVVNHLKSKGSACAGDPDLLDGQGNCSQTRRAAAEALVDWLATDPTGSGDPDFLIAGDLNSYAMEDTIDEIKQGADDVDDSADDWTNLIEDHIGTYAYSYVFDGMSGYLDHALANATLSGQVTGATEWHINADEPDVLDYDTSFKPPAQDALYEANAYRTSDHDPVVVGLDLNAPPIFTIVKGLSCSTSGVGGSFLVSVGDIQTAAGDLTLSLTGNTNTTLVPNANVVISGAADRTIAIAVANKKTGTGVLTFTLSDGVNDVTFDINVQIGTDAHETLVGTDGADLIAGNQGIDDLSGLGGADVLCGGTGNDTIAGGEGNDALAGERGNDNLSGGEGDDALSGGAGIDTLTGDAGDDSLSGGDGNDSLTGGADADAFSGNAGADTNTDFNAGDGDTTDGT